MRRIDSEIASNTVFQMLLDDCWVLMNACPHEDKLRLMMRPETADVIATYKGIRALGLHKNKPPLSKENSYSPQPSQTHISQPIDESS